MMALQKPNRIHQLILILINFHLQQPWLLPHQRTLLKSLQTILPHQLQKRIRLSTLGDNFISLRNLILNQLRIFMCACMRWLKNREFSSRVRVSTGWKYGLFVFCVFDDVTHFSDSFFGMRIHLSLGGNAAGFWGFSDDAFKGFLDVFGEIDVAGWKLFLFVVFLFLQHNFLVFLVENAQGNFNVFLLIACYCFKMRRPLVLQMLCFSSGDHWGNRLQAIRILLHFYFLQSNICEHFSVKSYTFQKLLKLTLGPG